jgi:hypothetical protein
MLGRLEAPRGCLSRGVGGLDKAEEWYKSEVSPSLYSLRIFNFFSLLFECF